MPLAFLTQLLCFRLTKREGTRGREREIGRKKAMITEMGKEKKEGGRREKEDTDEEER